MLLDPSLDTGLRRPDCSTFFEDLVKMFLASMPVGVPAGQAGPRLVAFSGMLMACFRQSKRRAAQFMSMIFNQPVSAGWLVKMQNQVAAARTTW
jgi:hypothetical protein